MIRLLTPIVLLRYRRHHQWQVAGLMVGIMLLVVGRHLWLPLVGAVLISQDQLRPADALVPLAGERFRIIYSASLLQQGYARWFVLTNMAVDRREVGPDFQYLASARQDALEAGVPAPAIVEAQGAVATTYAEAQALRHLALKQGWRSLIVVTSPYHTFRSQVIFQDVFHDSGVDIMVHAVQPHWYNQENWWVWAGGRRTTAQEYLKLGLYYLGYHRWFQ